MGSYRVLQPAGMTWLLDLDGVVWLAEQPIPGSADAVARLRAEGERVIFLTNNSSARVGEYLEKLERCGVPAGESDLITSAQAAASLVEPHETVLVCAGPGVEEAVLAVGARPVRNGKADVVIVGWHRDFAFDRLDAAYKAVAGGARLIGTNDDATYPTDTGPVPGGGSLLAAVAYASGATPVVAGKPHAPMADLLRRQVDDARIMVGDRASTDGMLARRLDVPFGLVLTGVDRKDDDAPEDLEPDVVAADLATLVKERLR